MPLVCRYSPLEPTTGKPYAMAHVLDKFRFCPCCGAQKFTISSVKSKRCEACGFEYFLNPSAAVAAFITNKKGELLVEVRKNAPAQGTLDLPGGFSDLYETSEEGLRREVKEETGLSVEGLQFLFSLPNQYEYSGMTIHTLDMFYACRAIDESRLAAADDAAACQWVPPTQVQPAQFGLASIRKAVERWLNAGTFAEN